MSDKVKKVLFVVLVVVLILRTLIQGATISTLNDNIAISDEIIRSQQETIQLQEQEIEILEDKIENLTGDAPAEEDTFGDTEVFTA